MNTLCEKYIESLANKKRNPLNCDCPNCNHRLCNIELLNKQCSKCNFVFRTNIVGEPIIISIYGQPVSSGYFPRKKIEVSAIKPQIYKDIAKCPVCDTELTKRELDARFCRKCCNSFYVLKDGTPIIINIVDGKKIRDFEYD